MLPFTIEELEKEIAAGYVTRRKHKAGKYSILNYSSQSQYDSNWNPVTLNCRGLIIDEDNNIVARGFPKFFNYGEKPNDPIIYSDFCVATEKADGSLGVIYPAHFAGHKVATRGSFHSEQAEWASNWLFRKYGYKFKQPDGVTTLVEIIYKDNRIVLDYGDFEGLVLLGAIDNTTGADIPIWDIDWWEGERVKVYTDIKTAEAGCKLATSSEFSNQEGLVMTWYKPNQPSYRLKIKHQEYIRLHGVIHNFSKKRVWEALAEKQDFLAMLDDVPDEFYDMVHSVVEDLKGQYAAIEKEAVYDYRGISKISDRKQFALRAQDSKYKAILFMMLDGKDYSKAIWKIIEPRGDE